MASRLYLDTARLGLMRAGVQRFYQDFVRFSGEEGCTLYWEDFLRFGWNSWPDSLKKQYPHLSSWNGVSECKASLRRLVGAASNTPVILANRSSQLMKLAANLLFAFSRHVLVTDLAWPPYLDALTRERQRTRKQLTIARIRRTAFNPHNGNAELVETLANTFARSNCDGLFLPAVDHLGIRLPVNDIIRAIRERSALRFVVVDGAQAVAHTPLRLKECSCDFFLAGCHKWLGAYYPLGIGFFGNPRSAKRILQTISTLTKRQVLEDPLLRFTEELENGNSRRFGETVNVAPMLTAQAAATDLAGCCLADSLQSRIANVERLASRLHCSNWKTHLPDTSRRTGILMIQSRDNPDWSPDKLRWHLHTRGIPASTYPGGWIRLSMPEAPLSPDTLDALCRTLHAVSRTKRSPQPFIHADNEPMTPLPNVQS